MLEQGPSESYSQFIDKLAAALKDAPNLTTEVQDKLFRTLAFNNANSHTRTILATLPQGSPVDEMLVRTTKAEQNSQNAAFMATMHDAMKQQGHILAAALTKGKSKKNSSHHNKPSNVTCFRCGLIDADFTGQVRILAYALQPPVTIPKGSRIAQIVVLENSLPHRWQPREPHEKERLDGGFGSTGHDVFFTVDLKGRPVRTVFLQRGSQQVQQEVLLDTGSDVSILNQLYWPSNWPLQAPSNHIIEVGGMRIPLISTDPIRITFEDGQVIVARPYVMPLHAKIRGLMGRDVLSQLGLVLTSWPRISIFSSGHCRAATHPEDHLVD
ncbi:hypothetical protein HGM15179_014919 [Zosterops borbonicus]|uniref:Peptidase A2 domain-containing protein n=1 Tax=Zosterops borbonicus TaxID=364589 RepID=A0A8K1G5X9_9PASS|nr:hypothetical protein HGM15179_014919 [Zosterops borbonicus]